MHTCRENEVFRLELDMKLLAMSTQLSGVLGNWYIQQYSTRWHGRHGVVVCVRQRDRGERRDLHLLLHG